MATLIARDILQAATTITATETVMGGEIACGHYDSFTLWLVYTKGDETGVYIVPKFLYETGGDEYPLCTWSTDADRTVTARRFYLTATGKHYVVLDIRGIELCKVYCDANAGTPTGTLAAYYTITRD